MRGLLFVTPRDIGGMYRVHGERETTPHMGIQPPTGREDDKKEIIRRLVSNDSTESSKTHKGGVSIISIVGKGGIGKTTLAKMVFKETEEHFGKRRWWVCVSERPNHKDLLRKILKEVHKESKEDIDSSLSDLCTQLQKELSKEKFLLVLDDVWELDWWFGVLEETLMAGAVGSNILLTSRKKYLSGELRASYMHELREFSFEQSWELFLKEALRRGLTEEDLAVHNIKDVGESIVKKCGGLPLVIRTVGSIMRTKKMSRKVWKFVENSKIWEWEMPGVSSSSTEIGGGILHGFMRSYDDLPYHLKSCFVYCCIYPKDYEIERETLIMQWVAHGLIEKNEILDVEATANQYIEDLISRCLIEEIDLKRIKLHVILHDLASYIGGREYSHASTIEHTHHLSLLDVDDAEVAMHNATRATNKLRTLLTESLRLVQLTNFKWLKVLSLRRCQMDELPKFIEDLALLQYLDLRSSYVRRLPSSIGRLCNLQTLDLSDSRVEELPKEMGELCNLRYLGLKHARELKFVAEGLGKLTNLWTLHRFLICDDKGDTKGCDIMELKDLRKLKGELSIGGLGRSRNAIDHVGNAQLLKEKHGIISLEFDFGIIKGDDEQSGGDGKESGAFEHRGLLEALKPPLGLECLKIRDYKGTMPAWHLKTEYTRLQTLKLVRCTLWEKTICIASLKVLNVINCPTLCEIASIPALESLKVEACGSLEQLPHHMPALKSLKVDGCNRLKALVNMPALESLEVSRCGSLEQLPHHMPALKSLKLYGCNGDGWPAGGSGKTTFTSMSCLREVDFGFCPKMEIEGLIDELAGLPKLTLLRCPSARLGWKFLGQLPNLIELELDSASTVLLPSPLPSQVSTFLPSLKHLYLNDKTYVDEKVKWGRVPEWVWALSQLEDLDLYFFSEDISLGGHWQCLPKLRYLRLYEFPNLRSLVEVNNNITLQQQQENETTTCPTDAQQQQIACLSNLQCLDISFCPALRMPQQLRDHLGKSLNVYNRW